MKVDGTAVEQTKVYNVNKIREDFPILKKLIHGELLVYLDNAATTQKPYYVINKTNNYYEKMNANIHRGVHALSQDATEAFEASRIIVKKFINALGKNEIIFTRGTTESINLVASTYGRSNIKDGDEIIISHMEHHSNIVHAGACVMTCLRPLEIRKQNHCLLVRTQRLGWNCVTLL